MTDPIRLDARADTGNQLQGCGALLHQARNKAGIRLADASAELKMPVRVLEAIEQENWQQLGAPVFIRGQVRSYAKLLKVDVEPYLEQARFHGVQVAELVSHSHVPRYRRVMESMARRAVYVVITAAIAVPVWVATQSQAGRGAAQTTASLDVVPAAGELPAMAAANAAKPAKAAAPYIASLAPIPRVNSNALTLRMTGDSWVQIHAPDGKSVEQGLLKAGEERSFRAGEIGRVVLGNAAAVEVQQAGSTVDMTPYQRANVARFTVSSDGSLAPVAN
jgi:cytoskeleton protein RodZ